MSGSADPRGAADTRHDRRGDIAPPAERATILYVHSSDELYGSDLTLLQLVRALDRGRFRPIVALPTDLPYAGMLSAALTEAGIEWRKLDLAVIRRRYLTLPGTLRFGGRLARSTLQLLGVIRREHVDLVHSNTIVVWPGALAAFLSRRPHVWHIHELLTGPARLRTLLGRVVLTLSTVVVCNSAATHQALLGRRGRRRRTAIIHNGIELPPADDPAARARIRDALRIASDRIVVGTIGRVSRRKGQRDLLCAAKEVVAGYPESHFLIVGGPVPGQEHLFAALQADAATMGLAENVTFTGFRRDVIDLLRAVDILVLPSLLPESFGLTALEAMACGKPVIATRLGGPREIVVAGETGLFVPAGSPPALVEAITSLLADAPRRERLGRAGRARVEACFTLDGYVRKFVDLYAGLLPRAPDCRP